MRYTARLACAAATAVPWLAPAQVANFDVTTDRVMIPSVAVADATYTNVVLMHRGNLAFSLVSATPQVPPAPGAARYDLATQRLNIPAVKVGEQTYVDVVLHNTGNFVFSVTAATLLPQATTDAVAAVLNASAQAFATDPPAVSWRTHFDSCYRHDGYTDPLAEANRQLRRSSLSFAGNVQVLAVRDSTNSDGSQRREIDVEYDSVDLDGTRFYRLKTTLISGSSAGTPGCATGQVGDALRVFGNQQIGSAQSFFRTSRIAGYSIANGLPLSPPTIWRRDAAFSYVDPQGRTTYVILSGPGLGSRKLISPQLLANAPELAGKRGNFINLPPDHPFMFCRGPGGAVASAETADCVGQGAGGYDHGLSTPTPGAAADAAFDALGFLLRGVYRFDVFNDDGWKTVNGHAGRVPVATYHSTLPETAMTFAEAVIEIPLLTPSGTNEFHGNLLRPVPDPVTLGWSQNPQPPSRYVNWIAWNVQQGPRTGNQGGAAWPAFRSIQPFAVPPNVTSYANWPVLSRQPDQSSKTYTDFTVQWLDLRTGNLVQSVLTYQ
jgi:hypothetical protein